MTFFIHLTFSCTISHCCVSMIYFFFHFIVLFYVFLRPSSTQSLLLCVICRDELIDFHIHSSWQLLKARNRNNSNYRKQKTNNYCSKYPNHRDVDPNSWNDWIQGPGGFQNWHLSQRVCFFLSYNRQTFPIGQSTSQQTAPRSPLYSAETS